MKTTVPAKTTAILWCFHIFSRVWGSLALSFASGFGVEGEVVGDGFGLGEGGFLSGLRLDASWSVDDRVRHLRG